MGTCVNKLSDMPDLSYKLRISNRSNASVDKISDVVSEYIFQHMRSYLVFCTVQSTNIGQYSSFRKGRCGYGIVRSKSLLRNKLSSNAELHTFNCKIRTRVYMKESKGISKWQT